jgi:hypothetical protein
MLELEILSIGWIYESIGSKGDLGTGDSGTREGNFYTY